jgi:hypothetical protein
LELFEEREGYNGMSQKIELLKLAKAGWVNLGPCKRLLLNLLPGMILTFIDGLKLL